MHYYQFNIGDYASHTSRLSPIEDLAYRRMLDLYYLSEQPLNGCVTDVARELGLSEYTSEVEYILSKFFIKNENGFSQKRIDLEIKKYKSNAKNKSKAGKASAKARQAKASGKVTDVEQVLNTTATDEQLNINHKPLTNNHKPLTTKQSNKNFCQLVADEYNKILGDVLPGAKAISDKRVGLVNGTVKQFKDSDKDFSDIKVWNQYFNFVRESEFLMHGSGNWTANFEFLINKNNVLKAREGNYHNDN